MINLAIIASCAIAMLLLIGGLVWYGVLNKPLPSQVKNEAQTQLTLLAGDLALPSHTVASGISNPADLQFVRERNPKLEKLFLKERAKLARHWLRENRDFLNRLMRLHRLIARASANLSVGAELRVMSICMALKGLLVVCDVLVLLVGPFRTRHMGSLAMAMFDHLSATLGSMAGTLDAGQKAIIRADWVRAA